MKHQQQWAEYVSPDFIQMPKFQIKRFDDGRGNRFYYFWNPGPCIGAGITSLLSQAMPNNPFLTDWKIKKDGGEKELFNSSNYGTALHVLYGYWMKEQRIPADALAEAKRWAQMGGQSEDMPIKDVLAFIRWMEDKKVKPLLIEAMLPFNLYYDKEWSYGITTMDLLCELKTETKVKKIIENGVYVRGEKKGMPKYEEVNEVVENVELAIVDFKSNYFEKDRKSFYESHLMQLIAGSKAVANNFNIYVDNLYNFSPNAWKTEPGYTFYKWNYTSEHIDLFNMYMELAYKKGLHKPSGTFFIEPDLAELKSSKDFEIIDYPTYVERFLNDNKPIGI